MSKKTLGKIKKPSVEEYKRYGKKRKLYLVPLLISGEEMDISEDYKNKLKKYWKQVEARLGELEEKIGRVTKIYCEMVDREGEKAEEVIQKMDKMLWQMVKYFLDKGARLKGIEDAVLLREHFDWLRCLSLNLKSDRVKGFITSFFAQNLRERDEHISGVINKDLGPEEIAVLFIRENNSLKLARDIEIFRIFPPVLNELRNYFQRK
ncbi:hypothetical protein DRJ04_02840 [Candidatus Aerophobetes bacterium]|uniref:Uncharacterized protein n=1 Tax=Aerophobetes bacterium TaxID=2030807 RepID=A0A662DJY4_UNCAE|nr:MAG: hypothetical protein DRJ04_02840 [Candidatus Aerophobetes bacterium]